jgi:hypothetical protein
VEPAGRHAGCTSDALSVPLWSADDSDRGKKAASDCVRGVDTVLGRRVGGPFHRSNCLGTTAATAAAAPPPSASRRGGAKQGGNGKQGGGKKAARAEAVMSRP